MSISEGNGIGDEGLRALAAGVRRNSALEELSIEGEAGGEDIAAVDSGCLAFRGSLK